VETEEQHPFRLRSGTDISKASLRSVGLFSNEKNTVTSEQKVDVDVVGPSSPGLSGS
jgi:hypothetical protein